MHGAGYENSQFDRKIERTTKAIRKAKHVNKQQEKKYTIPILVLVLMTQLDQSHLAVL